MAEKDIDTKRLEDYTDVFSDEPWNGAVSIRELVHIPPEFEKYVQDYSMHVFDIAFLDDKTIDNFSSDFGIAARFFKNRRLGNNIEDKTEIKHVEAFLDMLSAFTKDDRYRNTMSYLEKYRKRGKVVNMCRVAQGLINEGIELGINKGMLRGRLKTIADFLRNGGTAAQAEQMLNATGEEIEQAGEFLAAE